MLSLELFVLALLTGCMAEADAHMWDPSLFGCCFQVLAFEVGKKVLCVAVQCTNFIFAAFANSVVCMASDLENPNQFHFSNVEIFLGTNTSVCHPCCYVSK